MGAHDTHRPNQMADEGDSNNHPLIVVHGGWCPNIDKTVLGPYTGSDGDFHVNFEDYYESAVPETLLASFKYKDGVISNIVLKTSNGKIYVESDIEWDDGAQLGLFISKTKLFSNKLASKTDKNVVCQKIISRIIKENHHSHQYHNGDEDGLLSLKDFGSDITISIKQQQTRSAIISHYVDHYCDKIPSYEDVVYRLTDALLEKKSNELTPGDIERAVLGVKIFRMALGEAKHGMTFLKKNLVDMLPS
jgi:hypothetical protein